MTGHSRHTANASQSYTFASRTSQHTIQSLQKSMPAQPHCDRQPDDRKEQRRHNSTYKKLGVQWLIKHSTSHQLLCWLDSFVLRNPQLLVAANRQAVKKLTTPII